MIIKEHKKNIACMNKVELKNANKLTRANYKHAFQDL